MKVTAFLKAPQRQEIGPVVALHGPGRYLKHAALEAVSRRVLGADDVDIAQTRFSGKDIDLKTVCDELRTISMWGDRRLVVVEDADEFVSANRVGLEKYLEKPAPKSVLVLLVKSWPKTTRLVKAVSRVGLDLQCEELTSGELLRWLVENCQDEFGKQLTRDAAMLMVESAGTDLSLLDQELSKLAAYVGDRRQIDPEDVRAIVGGWKAETTWAMTGAVRDGKLGLALVCLDKLLVAGEAPQRILGGISFVFRRLAQATEIARQGTSLKSALQQAGVFPREITASARYLRRIGRPCAEKIYTWLLEADGNLKGNSRTPQRVQLEHLLIRLSGKV